MANEKYFLIKNIDELNKPAQLLADFLLPKTIFLFSGKMSSGKTTFISEVLKLNNYTGVTSPTYAFHNTYKLSSIVTVHHLDLHRIKTIDDLESLGLWDLFEQNSEDIFFIEWAARLQTDELPMNFKIIRVSIVLNNFNEREIKITF